MSEQVLVQFRVDKELKQEVSDIYEELGMDLPTALRMFLKRSKVVRGLPFDGVLPDTVITRSDAIDSFYEARQQLVSLSDVCDEDIDDEIKKIRESRVR